MPVSVWSINLLFFCLGSRLCYVKLKLLLIAIEYKSETNESRFVGGTLFLGCLTVTKICSCQVIYIDKYIDMGRTRCHMFPQETV